MSKKYYDGFAIVSVLTEHCSDEQFVTLLKAFSEVKGLDAVEVVRCKDCKHCSPNGVYGCRLEGFSYFGTSDRMYANDFCSRAERKEE